MLRFGSRGPEVQKLQQALNLDPGAYPLAPDGIFGTMTHNRVTGFQSKKGLAADGIVGPVTFAALQPLFDLLAKMVTGEMPLAEKALRERIRAEAQSLEAALGWNHPMKAPPAGGMQISLRRMSDPSTRARQGGKGLLTILHGGGAGGNYLARAEKIPPGMAQGEIVKGDLVADEKAYSQQRNDKDILSWCGVFALHVLRRSGVPLKGWQDGGGLIGQAAKAGAPAGGAHPLRVIASAEVRVGDIGVMSPSGRNHHFVVIGRSGGKLDTVDGNAGFHHSVIRTSYTMAKPDDDRAHLFQKVAGLGKGIEDCVFLSAFPMATPKLP